MNEYEEAIANSAYMTKDGREYFLRDLHQNPGYWALIVLTGTMTPDQAAEEISANVIPPGNHRDPQACVIEIPF